ncbi:MAG: hypothetical protein ACYCXT_04175 [Acidiferrobacteraceae bacterium]
MVPLTPRDILERYSILDYRICYRAAGAHLSTRVEAHARFALECGPGDLVADPLGQPLLFATEAQAFAYRARLGIRHPVLVFYEAGHEPALEEYDEERDGGLPDLARVTAYTEGRET